MFAPVASRFRTYDINCNEIATEYMQTVLDDADVRAWYADGVLETEIIEQIYDSALLIEGLHPDPSSMLPRIQDLMEKALIEGAMKPFSIMISE